MPSQLSESEVKSRWEEIRLVQETCIKIWQTYFQYYVWFFGANLISVGWVLTSKEPLKGQPVIMLSLVWIAVSIIVSPAPLIIGRYSKSAREQCLGLISEMDQTRLYERINVIFPKDLINYLPWANFISYWIAVIGWIFVAVTWGNLSLFGFYHVPRATLNEIQHLYD